MRKPNFIAPDVTVIDEPDILKKIEYCGRTAYASYDKITDDSASKFIRAIIGRGHESVLEHGNIVVDVLENAEMDELLWWYTFNTGRPHFIKNIVSNRNIFSGNVRAWRNLCKFEPRNNTLFALFGGEEFKSLFYDINFDPLLPAADRIRKNVGFVTSPEELLSYGPHHNVTTFKITCSRGITHELVRHRLESMTQNSTRYITYDNISFITPWWMDDKYVGNFSPEQISKGREIIERAAFQSAENYRAMLELEFPAQAARDCLTHGTSAEIVITATNYEWGEWLKLRGAPDAHPDAQKIAKLLMDLLTFKEGEV